MRGRPGIAAGVQNRPGHGAGARGPSREGAGARSSSRDKVHGASWGADVRSRKSAGGGLGEERDCSGGAPRAQLPCPAPSLIHQSPAEVVEIRTLGGHKGRRGLGRRSQPRAGFLGAPCTEGTMTGQPSVPQSAGAVGLGQSPSPMAHAHPIRATDHPASLTGGRACGCFGFRSNEAFASSRARGKALSLPQWCS